MLIEVSRKKGKPLASIVEDQEEDKHSEQGESEAEES
jgi:hypothetical protein